MRARRLTAVASPGGNAARNKKSQRTRRPKGRPAIPDTEILLLIAAAFLVGGVVKGTVGIGLPTVSLALMIGFMPLRDAVAVMAIPAVAANFVQSIQGDAFRELLRRHWALFLGAFAGIWIGTMALYGIDQRILIGVLGVLLCGYTAWSLATVPIRVPHRTIPWLGPLTGLTTGMVTGATGNLALPLMIYLTGLHLPKDRLVQLTGMVAVALTGGLALAASGKAQYGGPLLPLSLLAIIPSFAGMWAGRRLRQRLSEARFRRWILVFLFLLGLNLIRKSVF
ncbi:MAG: sulfite exporter TauE/SafE family protein [Rhodospirillaceae bacterium]|nr:sulfite exporter TauE/SafE family protein [Rhodospirillaceae bacterium]MBT6118844.1 sulfite exporter TauE/SafE family protein [Rhodospirillaceae bacterium]